MKRKYFGGHFSLFSNDSTFVFLRTVFATTTFFQLTMSTLRKKAKISCDASCGRVDQNRHMRGNEVSTNVIMRHIGGRRGGLKTE